MVRPNANIIAGSARKAELALRRGDLRNGFMQIKMAIAADPGSQFLRGALTEIETPGGQGTITR